ncbi:FKBP-type peptidyl-prolyl cis-trans isomerase [Actinopolymorpha pittospori]
MASKRKRREEARRQRYSEFDRLEKLAAVRRRRVRSALIVVTAVVLVAVVGTLVAVIVDRNGQSPVAGASGSATTSATPTAQPTEPSTAPAATGPSVSFRGVTVQGAADLGGAPAVTSKSSSDPTKLEYKDLVVGKGTAATPTSQVSVQYVGVLYKDGKVFDSSWSTGAPADFSLTGVVPGFTQGIGGTKGVPPMKVGGRRIIIMPAPLGYGSEARDSIPANSSLVFVVDLKNVTTSTAGG